MTNLKVVSGQVVEDVPETTLRDRRDEVHARHREGVRDCVHRWMMYGIETGHRKLYLDDCPGLGSGDRVWVAEWLREQGFTVKLPRWFGRPVVFLEECQ